MMRDRHQHRARRRYWQRGDEPEFGRLINFSDAVYAIALTLLALDLRVVDLQGDVDSPAVMWAALDDLVPQLVAFAVGFLLIAQYWLAHHDFVARLQAFDGRLMALNLAYLGFVAVLPFPTSLIGEYESNPVSAVVFAVALAAVSLAETVLLVHARRAGLLRAELSEPVYRWEVSASLQPAVMFLVTIPIAFIDPTAMLLSWLVLGFVLGKVVRRFRPSDAVT
jgi:uncharacterized membrane protein